MTPRPDAAKVLGNLLAEADTEHRFSGYEVELTESDLPDISLGYREGGTLRVRLTDYLASAPLEVLREIAEFTVLRKGNPDRRLFGPVTSEYLASNTFLRDTKLRATLRLTDGRRVTGSPALRIKSALRPFGNRFGFRRGEPSFAWREFDRVDERRVAAVVPMLRLMLFDPRLEASQCPDLVRRYAVWAAAAAIEAWDPATGHRDDDLFEEYMSAFDGRETAESMIRQIGWVMSYAESRKARGRVDVAPRVQLYDGRGGASVRPRVGTSSPQVGARVLHLREAGVRVLHGRQVPQARGVVPHHRLGGVGPLVVHQGVAVSQLQGGDSRGCRHKSKDREAEEGERRRSAPQRLRTHAHWCARSRPWKV